MSLPDFVQETLDILDTNWDTNNFSPQPTLVDGDEMRINADNSRGRSVDIVNTNVITVDSEPTATIEPIGLEFNLDIRYGVGVSIEGFHADGGGQCSDKDDFDSMVGEARRALYESRYRPFTPIFHLTIESEDDLSAADPRHADYFRYEFNVWYEGYERDLPPK